MKPNRADFPLNMRITKKTRDRIQAMMDKNEKNRPATVVDAIDEKFAREFPKGLPKKKNDA